MSAYDLAQHRARPSAANMTTIVFTYINGISFLVHPRFLTSSNQNDVINCRWDLSISRGTLKHTQTCMSTMLTKQQRRLRLSHHCLSMMEYQREDADMEHLLEYMMECHTATTDTDHVRWFKAKQNFVYYSCYTSYGENHLRAVLIGNIAIWFLFYFPMMIAVHNWWHKVYIHNVSTIWIQYIPISCTGFALCSSRLKY